MTVEEIDILVQANIEGALKEFKKLLPSVKKQLSGIQKEFDNINLKDINANINISKVKKDVQEAKKQIKEAFNPNDVSGMKINNKSIDDYGKKIKEIKPKIQEVKKEIESVGYVKYNTKSINDYISAFEKLDEKMQFKDKIQALDTGQVFTEKTNKIVTPQLKISANGGFSTKELELLSYKINEITEKLENAKNGKIQLGYGDIVKAEAELEKLIRKKRELEKEGKSNVFSKAIAKIKEVKSDIQDIVSLLPKIKNPLKGLNIKMKNGVGHVMKYAAALFSIRGIYSVLSSAAQSWLSSQNAEAKQLSANIEYMKYAMGSALAPVIQFVTNLVYQLMKAVQSVAYALTGVNIFAKASANSYASMAENAKKAKEETKQLAGIHSDINNISSNKSSDSGSGTSTPSFDLSQMDNTPSSIVDAIKNGNWEEIGSTIAQKLNETLEKIPWDTIQEKAGKIGTGLADTINGFVKTADWKLIGSTVGEGLNTAIIFANKFVKTLKFKDIGKSLSTGLNSAIKTIKWDTYGQTISDGILGVLDIAIEFIENLDTKGLTEAIIELVSNINWGEIAGKIVQLILDMILMVFEMLVSLPIIIGEKIAEKLKKGIDEAVRRTIQKDGDNSMTSLGEYLLLGLLEGIANIGDKMSQWIVDHIFQPFINTFKRLFGIHSPSTVMHEQGTFIMEGLLGGISSLVGKVTEIWNNIKTSIGNVVDNIKRSVKEKFTNIKNGVIDIFNGMKNSMSNIWNGIWNTIKGVINKIIDGIESFCNYIVDAVNGLIGTLNKFNVKLPGGKKIGISLNKADHVHIDRLATGNVAYEETFAIFGEYAGAKNNPEITAPQNVLRETFEDVLSNRELNNDNNSNSGLKQLIIQFGSTEVALEMESLIQQAKRTNGTATVTV